MPELKVYVTSGQFMMNRPHTDPVLPHSRMWPGSSQHTAMPTQQRKKKGLICDAELKCTLTI